MLRQMAALILVGSLTAVLASAASPETLDVVSSVDLSRYAGRWYEIARLPNRFQNKCAGEVVAAYALLEGGQLKVVNECRQENGQTITAEGEARLADRSGRNSKLKVRFAPAWLSWLPMVWGDYWIIDLASDYSVAVVGTPDRKYLWILSRAPKLGDAIYERIVKQTGAKGFDVSRLVKTRQAR